MGRFVEAPWGFGARRLFLLYALLLFASSAVRWWVSSPLRLIQPSQRLVEVPAVIGDKQDTSTVALAYRDMATAGEEHHRLVPQSEFVALAGGHLLIFSDPLSLVRPVRAFIERVEKGEAQTRVIADSARVRAANTPFDYAKVLPAQAITLLVTIALLMVFALVLEDGACIAAGLLVAHATLGFVPAFAACIMGAWTRGFLFYLAGRRRGKSFLHKVPFRWLVSKQTVELSECWFRRYGANLIFKTPFIPGIRPSIYFAVGVQKLNFWKFSFSSGLAVMVGKLFLVTLAMLAGGQVLDHFDLHQKETMFVLLFTGLLLYLLVKVGLPFCSCRGRRLLLSFWRRQTRWEFWPLWKFYPPVVFYILYLGLKYRSLTLFTVVNPAMTSSGFIGEAKSAILSGLGGAGDGVARWLLLKHTDEPEKQLVQVTAFMRTNNLDYPIVLKPDEGQRGLGVAVIRSPEQALGYLKRAPVDTLAQEKISGLEYGIFYYRYPEERSGHIFSITKKTFSLIEGDGERTLESLILSHSRMVCTAPFFLYQYCHRLFEVPPDGERIPLVELGTHSRGSLFLDGGHLKSPALTAVFDAISENYEGFFFGRYDVRAPSDDALREGREIKIIELNGITSEATHIYDPKNNLFYAYRTLMEQWRIAFAIGAHNRARGIEPISVVALAKHYREAVVRQRQITSVFDSWAAVN